MGILLVLACIGVLALCLMAIGAGMLLWFVLSEHTNKTPSLKQLKKEWQCSAVEDR